MNEVKGNFVVGGTYRLGLGVAKTDDKTEVTGEGVITVSGMSLFNDHFALAAMPALVVGAAPADAGGLTPAVGVGVELRGAPYFDRSAYFVPRVMIAAITPTNGDAGRARIEAGVDVPVGDGGIISNVSLGASYVNTGGAHEGIFTLSGGFDLANLMSGL